jgi:hypothetical protein
MIAKILELNIIKGSVVTSKIAGILSKKNRISVNSIVIKAPNKAVKHIYHLFWLNIYRHLKYLIF